MRMRLLNEDGIWVFGFLAAMEISFTVMKSALLITNRQEKAWKFCFWFCFLVESGLGILLNACLIKVFRTAMLFEYASLLAGVIIVSCTGVFVVIGEFAITRRRLGKVQTSEQSYLVKITRKVVNIASIVCAFSLLAAKIGILAFTGDISDISSVVFSMILLVACGIMILVSGYAREHCITRLIFAVIVLFSSVVLAIVSLHFDFFRVLAFSAILRIPDGSSTELHKETTAAVFLATIGTFLVVLSAWEIPDLRNESDPDLANVNVVETAAFGVGVPLFVLGLSEQPKVAKMIFFTILPQSMVIVGPIVTVFLSRLKQIKKSQEEEAMSEDKSVTNSEV